MGPRDAIEALFRAWEQGDNDAVADLFCDDGVYEDPLKPGRLEGREAIRAGNADAVAALADCRITTHHALEQGELGFAEGFFAAELRETGGRLDFPFALVLELRDGRIARIAEYFDTRPLAG